MSIKHLLRARVNVLAKPFRAVLVAVLPPGAAFKLEMKATKKEMKMREITKSIQEEVMETAENTMDHSMDATDKVLRWQSEVVNEIITPAVDTSIAYTEVEEPALVAVASEPVQTEEETEKLRAYYWRAIIEGPTGRIFTSLNPLCDPMPGAAAYTPHSPTSLHEPSSSAVAVDINLQSTPSSLQLPASASYIAFKANFEYHFNRVAEHPKDEDAREELHNFMLPIYFPNRG